MPAPTRAPRTSPTRKSGTPDQRHGIEPRIRIPIGIMTSAAANERSIANATFSSATKLVGIGASSRSSISRVQPNSATSGNASVCIAVSTDVSATRPGEEQVAVAVLGVAEAAQHLPEHEQHEERLQDHLREERGQLAAGDVQVAVQDREEGAARCGAGPRRRRSRSSAQRPSGEVDEDVLEGRRPELDVAEHEAVLGEHGGGRRDELRRITREVEPHAQPAVVLLLRGACRAAAAVLGRWTRSRRATPGSARAPRLRRRPPARRRSARASSRRGATASAPSGVSRASSFP